MVKRSPLRLRPERGFLRSQRESWNSRKNRINGQEGRRIEPEGNFTVEKKGPVKGRKMAHTGAGSRNNSAGKINIQNRQISKSVFYKMFPQPFAGLKIYLYLLAENPGKKLKKPIKGNLYK